jgi:2-C-methyl-D-erythritol 4-phosphate cytidylyltransferase
MSSSLVTRPSSLKYWAVVPAAGVGKRMHADRPKQYMQIDGRPLIEHAISRLLADPHIEGIVVAISKEDEYWPDLKLCLDKPLWVAEGGVERCHSVLNALQELATHASDDDWVLVHDAARPCVRPDDIANLIKQLADDAVGGLLAVPVRDTMKRTGSSRHVITTEAREGLWHALTPQMFRFGKLRHALEQVIEDEALVTDESSAMELAGNEPLLVEGHADNIKVTRPEDLALATFYLQQQSN